MIGATWALRAAREVYHPWYARPGPAVPAAARGRRSASAGAWRASAAGCRRARTACGTRSSSWSVDAAGLDRARRHARSGSCPAAAYLWLLPLLAAGRAPVGGAAVERVAIVRAVSLVVLAVAGDAVGPEHIDLLRFVVAALGRLPIVTPVVVYAALMAAGRRHDRAAADRRDRAERVRCCGRRWRPPSACSRSRSPPASRTRRRPTPTTRRCGGTRAACRKATVRRCGTSARSSPASISAPARRRAGRAASGRAAGVGAGQRRCRIRSCSAPTGPSLGPAPIGDRRAQRRAAGGRHRALGDGGAAACPAWRSRSSSRPASSRRGRACPASMRRGALDRDLRRAAGRRASCSAPASADTPAAALRDLRIVATLQGRARAGRCRPGCRRSARRGRRRRPGSSRRSRCRLRRCRRYVRLRNDYAI